MSNDAAHYVVTAHPPGAVLVTAKCNFLAPHTTDVIVAKSRRLEIRQLRTSSGSASSSSSSDQDLSASSPFPVVLTVPIHGRITSMLPLRVPMSKTSYLFLTTDRMRYAVISYAPETTSSSVYPLVTHASGSIKGEDQNAILGREAECAPLVAVDPFVRCIALHLYDGLLSFLPINLAYDGSSATAATPKKTGSMMGAHRSFRASLLGEPYHARIEERTVLDLTFLRVSPEKWPQICLLHQDSRCIQHVVSHVVDLKKRQLLLYGASSSSSGTKKDTNTAVDQSSNKEFLKKSRVDGGSSTLIAVPPPASAVASAAGSSSSTTTTKPSPNGGVLVLGQRQITYLSSKSTKVIPMPPSLILSWDELPPDSDGTPRYLLGDEFGHLHMLLVKTSGSNVTGLQLDTLGSCVIASSLRYLSDGLVFVGSQFGDSQLVQIHEEPISMEDANDEHNNIMMGPTTYLSVVEEYTHLGPIIDFDLVPTHASSSSSAAAAAGGATANNTSNAMQQSQVVTASGSSTSGTIRLVRNGIGMNEYASVEIPGIQNMWNVRKRFDDKEDGYLIQSFVGETRVLGVSSTPPVASDDDDMMDEEEEEEEEDGGGTLEEVFLSGLDSTASSLYVGNVQVGDLLVQITESRIRIIDAATLQCVDTWSPSVDDLFKEEGGGARLVTVASANESGQIVLALRGGMLLYFCIEQHADGCRIMLVDKTKMEREISCIDLNPFTTSGKDSSAMDVDTANVQTAPKSSLVAVGLWDDFTVRLLSLESKLDQVLQINLSTDEDEEAEELSTSASRTNRNNMMARSLCLITLDSSSSSSTSAGGTGASNASSAAGVDMLFVGLGDGTLVSFAVMTNNGSQDVSVRSKKEVSLGTQRINLIPLRTERGGTCILATGDRPTVIYLAGGGGSTGVNFSNPKLCYSNVNLSTNDVEEDGVSRPPAQQSIAVNVATPFASPLLFDPALLGSKHYSLCVADDSNLRLGVIDDIQKLHVTTCRLGMAPRRIVHCAEGRLFAVGCIDNGTGGGGMAGESVNMGNCIRFLDDTTFDDVERINLEPYEMIQSMVSARLCTVDSAAGLTEDAAIAVDGSNGTSRTLSCKPYLLVGTAYALPDEDEPTRGRIIVLSCTSGGVDGASGSEAAAGSSARPIRQVTELQVRGAVYSMCEFFEGKLLATIGSKTQMCQLADDGTGVLKLNTVGIGHHGHILSLAVKSRAGRSLGMVGSDTNATPASNAIMEETPVKKSRQQLEEEEEEQLAIVGDLMRSISLVRYYPKYQTLEELARDFNTNWTTAIEMLTDDVYLGAENWNNLFVLRRNAKAQSEEIRCRLDTVGEFHLGEMVNKFMSGSLVMPHSTSSASARRGNVTSARPSSRDGKSKASGTTRTRRPTVAIGSQTLYATVDGTLGSVLGLDKRSAVFFSALERAMERIIPAVGDFNHHEFRAFDAEERLHPSHGFVDGDLVESFLDLDRATMESVVREMNREGRWEVEEHSAAAGGTREDDADGVGRSSGGSSLMEGDNDEEMKTNNGNVLTVEDTLAMVEEMTMLH